MQVPTKTYYSPQEYLALETAAEFRSENTNDRIMLMADSKVNHNKLSLNLSGALNFELKKLRSPRARRTVRNESKRNTFNLSAPELTLPIARPT